MASRLKKSPKIPPSPWSIDYEPEIGTSSVSIRYNGTPVGRVQSATLKFDTTTHIPILNLEIFVPGIVINGSDVDPTVKG